MLRRLIGNLKNSGAIFKGNPRRTTAYCLQRRILSETFGERLYYAEK